MERDPQAEIILDNEAKGDGYCPYCLRCRGLVRMVKHLPHFWRCADCAALCDLRKYAEWRKRRKPEAK